jgi:hypothetical protein
VVNALLEVGGRELVILTENDGTSCLWIGTQLGHLDVVRALLEGGGRELLMLTGQWNQLPLRQCGEGASGCGERAAGGRESRAADADRGRWIQPLQGQCGGSESAQLLPPSTPCATSRVCSAPYPAP